MKSPLIAILAAAALFATNPTPQAYSDWLKQEALRTQSGDAFGSLLVGLLAAPVIQATTRQENFGLFSIYRTSVASADDVVALGIFSHFLLLPKPTPSSPTYLHVINAGTGWVKPEDGYVWVRQPPSGDFRVRWQPGKLSENHPHVVAAAAEERWLPEDGYAWNIDPPPVGELRVHWVPGKPSAKFMNVVAATDEGRWSPATGFRWLTDPPPAGDLRVVAKEPPRISSTSTVPPKNIDLKTPWRQQYLSDLACDRANPPCPKWWDYARRVSQELGLPLCPMDFQRDLAAQRYYSSRTLPLMQACVVPGGLTSTGPLRCNHDGCCKPGANC